VLFLHACSDQDEVDAETAAILKQVPPGMAWKDLPAAMQRLGFSCTQRGSDLSCERETNHWLVCTKRTRAILLQQNGRLSNVLVNVGRFC